jgi:outer membrane protein assembly factor BamB
MVFVGSDGMVISEEGYSANNVYAINATSGAIMWIYSTGGPVYSSPAIADGIVYFGSSDGKVYAIGTVPTQLPSASPSASELPVASPTPAVPELTPLVIFI